MEWLRYLLGLPPGQAESDRLIQHVIDLNTQKNSLLDAGDYVAALRIEEKCIRILKRLWSVHDLGRAYNNAGRICEELRRWRHALIYFRKGLKEWTRTGESRGQAVARAGLGRVLMQVDEVDLATDELEIARKLFAKAEHDEGVAHVLQLLVDAYSRLTLPDEELARAQDLVKVCQRLPDKELTARARHLLGNAERKLEHYDASVDNLKSAKAAYQKLKKEEERAAVVEDLASTYLAQQLFNEARAELEDALRFWARKHEQVHEARVQNRLGTVRSMAGEYRKAEHHYHEALKLVPMLHGEERAQAEGTIHYNLADLNLKQGRYEAAIDYADRADKIFMAAHDYPGSLMALKLKARAEDDQRER